jgi:uncharacterized protein YcbX
VRKGADGSAATPLVAELWRYPVKSMRGERLEAVDVDHDGLRGDRVLRVDEGSDLVTARSRPDLLGLSATIGTTGEPLIDGHDWRSVRAAALLDLASPGGGFASTRSGERFDSSPVHLIGMGTVASLGIDSRRLRANVIVAGIAALEEERWVGHELGVGEAVLRVGGRCERCVVTTFDPDTIDQDPGVLRRINSEFGRCIGVLCDVVEPGLARIGDPVRLP